MQGLLWETWNPVFVPLRLFVPCVAKGFSYSDHWRARPLLNSEIMEKMNQHEWLPASGPAALATSSSGDDSVVVPAFRFLDGAEVSTVPPVNNV